MHRAGVAMVETDLGAPRTGGPGGSWHGAVALAMVEAGRRGVTGESPAMDPSALASPLVGHGWYAREPATPLPPPPYTRPPKVSRMTADERVVAARCAAVARGDW